ncbi:glycosyltransferase family 1 [Paramyrothecium foliicola]|nr:glycosyltransferase family 1 [Paramyrothecium foliicola]
MTATRGLFFTLSVAIAAFAFVLFQRASPDQVPRAAGRNGTVLFLTTDASGLSNVHVATSAALLEFHPDLEVHYASFSKLESRISSISAAVRAKKPLATPIYWHELPSPGFAEVFDRHWGNDVGMIMDYGAKGFTKKRKDLVTSLAPWEADEHLAIYNAMAELVDQIDPALVVIDNMLIPAMDFARNNNRHFLSLNPNALLELIAVDQPRAGMFWKYPAALTGFPFPVPWELVPMNVLATLRVVWSLITSPELSSKRKILVAKGIKGALFPGIILKDTPLLTPTIPEANIPMEFYPPYLKFCGPIVDNAASLEDQDPLLATWLKQAPTVLINLGSLFKYDKRRARVMADAIATILTEADVQVLWKFTKLGDYDDEPLSSVAGHISTGRLRMETWLKPEPIALFETGDVVLSVHHGGANSYHEAILAGIPHIILPLWFDLYNIARAAEYRGIGIWPGKDTAPEWAVDKLVEGFRAALTGPTSVSLKTNAQALGVIARQYGGQRTAASFISDLATHRGNKTEKEEQL